MNIEDVTDFPDVQTELIADLKSRGVSTRVHKLGEAHYSCRMTPSDGRDGEVVYKGTPEEAVDLCAKNLRATHSDLFDG